MSDLTSNLDPMISDIHFRLPRSLDLRLTEVSKQNSIKKSQLMRLILNQHLHEYSPKQYRKEMSYDEN